MKVLFTGGGTGGHLFPIIAIIRELKKISTRKDIDLFYAGPKDALADTLFAEEEIKVKKILAGKIRRYFSLMNFIDLFFKVPLGIIQSFFYIFFLSPDLIFAKGGYGSFPIVFAGWFLRVPIFLHESDIAPGLVNKYLDKFSIENFISFRDTEHFSSKKMIVVGNPIRKEILKGSTKEAKKLLNLKGGKPVLLILGGSQGAELINDIILDILEEMLKEFELIHQCGEKNFQKIEIETKARLKGSQKSFYHLFPFLKEEEIKHAYAAADLIISRAGSGVIFEIAALGKPSILIPLSNSAQNHQLKNAYNFAEGGRAIVLEEANLTSHFFLGRLKYLFTNVYELKSLGHNAQAWSRPRAAEIIAEYIKEYLLK